MRRPVGQVAVRRDRAAPTRIATIWSSDGCAKPTLPQPGSVHFATHVPYSASVWQFAHAPFWFTHAFTPSHVPLGSVSAVAS